MAVLNGDSVPHERTWLVWALRLLMAGGVGWTLYTVQQTAVIVEGIRVLVATQSHQLERLEIWRDSSKK